MSNMQCILVEQKDGGSAARLAEVADDLLPQASANGEVLVDIDYSTLNYKDALAITGKSPVVRKFPMVPGIDFAGTVADSTDARWKKGDPVLLNGWGVGESHWGGLAQKAKVKADWLTARPEGMAARDAMALGTAGYTAMLCVMALERHGVRPGGGPILVTGAGGGVGGVAIALLSRLGHEVVASSGRPQEADYFRKLGAADVIDRATLSAPGKPLAKERWAGVVDSVGSHTLANACAATRYGGAVAACGLAGGMDFPGSVAPFILRGVVLHGIDSVMAPLATRTAAWDRLAAQVDRDLLGTITSEIALGECIDAGAALLAGRIRGRLVVDVNR
jgi:acrylyl-CoA reductase (NADPH)